MMLANLIGDTVLTPAGRDTQEGRPVTRSSNPLITVSGTKWMLDGVRWKELSRRATILQP